MRRKKRSLALWIGMGMMALLHAEPSVYGRSTSSSVQIYALKQQVAQMREEMEGLRSLVQSLNQRLGQLENRQRNQAGGASIDTLKRQIGALEARVATLEKRKPASSAKAVKSGSKAKSAKLSKPSSSGKNGSKNGSSKVSSALEKAPSNKLFSRGVRLIHQKRYADAKLRFDILQKRKYKPASTQFYLGEIAYRTGAYDEAIQHYQKSAELNENAAYMDRLLLHTGIALERTGDKAQAKNFFQAIVDGYPGTSSAREAKKHLK